MMFLTHRYVTLNVRRRLITELGIVLPKQYLVWGSMRPDFVKHPVSHFWNERGDLFYAKWDVLCAIDWERQPDLFSLELGEIFHFLCDYFCYAHNEPSLQQEVWYHLKYENELHRYVKQAEFQQLGVSDADYSMVPFQILIEYKHSQFLNRLPSFENDLRSSFEMCMIVARKRFELPGLTSIYQSA